MAYVNVRDWSVDQVTDWLKGLDGVVLQYTPSFLNNGVTGHQLLNLRSDDLEHLGVKSLGHQEIILEAVEHLRNFHYELDKENLQMLALRVSCTSNSLYRELLLVDDDCAMVPSQTMADVHNIVNAVKPLCCWLDRAPFAGDKDYIDCKTQLLELCFEMATSAHRGIFWDKPVCSIKINCEKIAKIADHIIQEISDPMILQPASLDLATLKKREQELGFFILPSNHAVHQIAEIKYGSPAHSSSKIEEGDEIVQVNYQTVVGWQPKKVMILLQDSPPEIVLTLKKRPRHTKVYGQIYMKPYRLPSKKRDGHPFSRWNESIPSPRLLPISNLPPLVKTKWPSVTEPPDVEAEMSSSDSEPPDSPLDGCGRMYPLKPRPILQRRNTITGATPTSKRPYPSVEQYWQILKDQAASAHSSQYNIDKSNKTFDQQESHFLRDKSASCNLGLELSPRPTTVIGISPSRGHGGKKSSSFKNNFNKDKPLVRKKVVFEESKQQVESNKALKVEFDESRSADNLFLSTGAVSATSNLNEEKSVSVNSLASLNNEQIAFIDEGRELTDRTSMVTETLDIMKLENKTSSNNSAVAPPPPPPTTLDCATKDTETYNINIHDIIKKFDEQKQEMQPMTSSKPKIHPRSQVKKPPPDLPSQQKPPPDVVPVATTSHCPAAVIGNSKKPVVPPRTVSVLTNNNSNNTTKPVIVRGRLDKSHSTPAYDLTEENDEREGMVGGGGASGSTTVMAVCEKLAGAAAEGTAEGGSPPKTTSSHQQIVGQQQQPSPQSQNQVQEQLSIQQLELPETPATPNKTTTCSTSDLSKIEPFSETTYQLGIPVVENLPVTPMNVALMNVTSTPLPLEKLKPHISSSSKEAETEITIKDTPPKPPPRNFGLATDIMPKPAYPSDSPKPTILNYEKTPTRFDSSIHSKQVFEFPDSSTTSNVKQSLSYSTASVDANASPYLSGGEQQQPSSLVETSVKLIGTGGSAGPIGNNNGSKMFEPKNVSTPKLSKNYDYAPVADNDVVLHSKSNFDVQKSMSDSKISPTNSIVRAMIYSNKNKSGKKKTHIITAKRRNVTVNELNPPDIQGYLYQRLRSKHNQNVHWERRWFVLLNSCLYGFRAKEDPRAACLIFLSGFTVAVANEVKSRSNAFKVYHTGTVFYFSAEDPENLQLWFELITAATMVNDPTMKTSNGSLYSETDEEEENHNEKTKLAAQQPEKNSNESLKKFGSLKKFATAATSRKHSTTEVASGHPTTSGSTSLDRKWFFNKTSSNHNQQHSKNALPVPTAQFRSYRKVRSPSDASSPQSHSITTGNFTSHVAAFFVSPQTEIPNRNVSVPNLATATHSNKEEPVPPPVGASATGGTPASSAQNEDPKTSSVKPTPINYVHASNPALCNLNDFDVVAPHFARKGAGLLIDEPTSIAGFVTLEQLMIKQSEERRLNPYNMVEEEQTYNLDLIRPDVVYGEVPIRPREKSNQENRDKEYRQETSYYGNKRDQSRAIYQKISPPSTTVTIEKPQPQDTESSSGSSSSCFGKRLGSLKKSHNKENVDNDNESDHCRTATYPKTTKSFEQKLLNRSLPRTAKLQEGHRTQQYSPAASRNSFQSAQEFKDRSYEMIYCPETTTSDIQFAQNRYLDDRMYDSTTVMPTTSTNKSSSGNKKVKKQHSFSGDGKKQSSNSSKSHFLDTSRYTNKVQDSSSSKIKLKSATQYTPMSLPLIGGGTSGHDPKSKPKLAFELNLDEKNVGSTNNTNHTKGNGSGGGGGKLKQIFGGGSSKQQQGVDRKEKTFLGSPKLHRAIFRKNPQDTQQRGVKSNWPSSPIQAASMLSQSTSSLVDTIHHLPLPPTPTSTNKSSTSTSSMISPHADYPGLEYPPVFEPETYSLADPQSSLHLLRGGGGGSSKTPGGGGSVNTSGNN